MRVPTGIGPIDGLVEGGLPEGSTVMVIGQPGTGKTSACRDFICDGLARGEPCVYISTSASPEEIFSCRADRGLKDKGSLLVVDAYSWRSKTMKEQEGVLSVPSLTDLHEFNAIISKAMSKLGIEGKRGRIVFDSFSDVLMYGEKQSVYQFVQLFVSKVRDLSSVSLLAVEEGLHEPRDIATLNYITDGTVAMRVEGEKRLVQVPRMKNTVHTLESREFSIKAGKISGSPQQKRV